MNESQKELEPLESIREEEDLVIKESGELGENKITEEFIEKVKPEISPDFYKTKICRHFVNGICKLGGICNFAHGEDELREVDESEPEPKIKCNLDKASHQGTFF